MTAALTRSAPLAAGEPLPFDVCGELPHGTTVLEASAGTGKTYAIAALAARYVAEGVELGAIMMVTFGRTATDELRLRVRDRLTSLERRLSAALAGGAAPTPRDEVERLLLDGPAEILRLRHVRLARAVSDFDAATIATTHEFCARMLDGLGVLAAAEPDAVFVEHLTELSGQVARDLYLARYADEGRAPMPFVEAERLAWKVVEARHARLAPEAGDGTHPEGPGGPAERVAFAEAVRAEVRRRQVAGRLVTYDDLLTRLRDALADPRTAPAAAARLRTQYAVVLVDEFQDTDPVQWEILARAFHSHTTLILIGDPKQAIYAFRGADVFSYLEARDQASRVSTLATNWRSDAALTTALHALLVGAALGDPRIVVREVTSHHPGSRLTAPADGPAGGPAAPVRLRVLPYDSEQPRFVRVDQLRAEIVQDLVADITHLLASGLELREDGRGRRVQPGDVAVLVRSNKRGEAVRDALLGRGVPAVMLGATSVYTSAVAEDWLTLLLACEQPRQRQVRAAALTCFLGWTFRRLAAAGEDELTELTLRARGWARVLATRGVAALLETVSSQTGLTERLLSVNGGERVLTDLRHLAQSLHAEMAARRLGVPALVAWLREQMAEARADALTDGTRRLESDAAAVQILTLHRSKGLEYPIVYLPEAWDRHVNTKDDGRLLDLHDPAGRCVVDVGGAAAPGRADRLAQARAEEAGEELRLLYVGLTRARSQVVTWWAPSANTATSPLQRLLGRGPGASEPPVRGEFSADPLDREDLRAAGFSLERVERREPAAVDGRGDRDAPLTVRTFERALDLDWRRTSYSALTAAAHGVDLAPSAVGSEPEPAREDDEAAPAASVE
ncbi:MAG: UvrD-helicase domain-containing protein, partial [Actinomycetes bacterium]